MNERKDFPLAKSIDKYLGALSRLYARDGERNLQEILVNASVRVTEGTTYDRWDGGIWGHTLHLTLPESVYLPNVKDKGDIQNKLCQDLNKVHPFEDEHIHEVTLDFEIEDGTDWRKDSGLLISGVPQVSAEAEARLWPENHYRIFLSHKTSVKVEVSNLAHRLNYFGASCFVAHENIQATKKWQEEIENALASMDCLVALMTSDFHDSEWTDQEVGFAFARGVPIVAVRIGLDPYGFIGKFQALTCGWDNAHTELMKLLINNDRMLGAYLRKLPMCPNFVTGNMLGEVLPSIQKLTNEQIGQFVNAYNLSTELKGSWVFRGDRPYFHGPGLVHHLNRLAPNRAFSLGIDGLIDEDIPF